MLPRSSLAGKAVPWEQGKAGLGAGPGEPRGWQQPQPSSTLWIFLETRSRSSPCATHCQQCSSTHKPSTDPNWAVPAHPKLGTPVPSPGNLPWQRQHHPELHLLAQFSSESDLLRKSHFNFLLAPFPVGNGCHHFLTRGDSQAGALCLFPLLLL